jgi:hypothetical protein
MGFPAQADLPEEKSALASTVQRVKKMKTGRKILVGSHIQHSSNKPGGHGAQLQPILIYTTCSTMQDAEISPLALPSPLVPLY